jgi:rod shape-determining protein MreC
VFPHSSQVLAINDQTSGAGVILEATRTRGILRGNAAGVLEVVDILADKRIQKGDKVLTAGGDQIFPRGLPVGVVDKIVPDPQRDSFIDVIVTPAAHIDRLDEVLVVTSTEPRFNAQDQQDIATSQALKGPEAAAISEQKKASEIMAERLPGLVDPNLPPDQQPAHDGAAPVVVPHPPPALHPDRFSPGSSTNATPNGGTSATPVTQTPAEPESIAPAKQNKPAKTSNPSAPTPVQPQPNRPQANKPQRNP